MFKTETPVDIDSYTVDQVVDLVEDPEGVFPSKKVRLRLIKQLYEVLGFNLTSDVALAALAYVTRKMIVATAGSGKTTGASLIVLLEKLISANNPNEKSLSGYDILCLVYNKHNVDPIKAKHAGMVDKLIRSGATKATLDREVKAMTLHSFCEMWLKEYPIECGVDGYSVANDGEIQQYAKQAVDLLIKKHKLDPAVMINFSTLVAWYTYARETLQDLTSPRLREEFPDIKLSDELILDFFVMYAQIKKMKKKYEYVDQLFLVYQLLKENESARNRVQAYYRRIVADEYQDFTPLMREILVLAAGDRPLLAIGDEDQTLYGFKGADMDNMLKFTEAFPGGKIYTMNYNRRCPSNIVDLGTKIIEQNTQRFNKRILSNKPPGNIVLNGYATEEGMIHLIVNKIAEMSAEEQQETVVCFRDKIYATRITEALEQRRIGFNILSGYGPFDHELFTHVINVMDLLYDPGEASMHRYLYKVLPPHSRELYEIIGYQPSTRKMKDKRPRYSMFEYDFGKFEKSEGFNRQRQQLIDICKMVGTQDMSTYFDQVYDLICKNFWNYKKEMNRKNTIDEYYTRRVFEFFNVKKTYYELSNELSARKERIRILSQAKAGVTVGTFHSLKGLEFDNVFMTYMDDNVFPNLDMSSRNSDEDSVQNSIESENRLAFVGVTRSKKNLYMSYPENNPSRYVRIAMRFLESNSGKSAVVPDVFNLDEALESEGIVLSAESPAAKSPTAGASFLNNVMSNFKK